MRDRVVIRYADHARSLRASIDREAYSDAFLICSDQRVLKTHRLILASISEVFSLILSESRDSSSAYISLPDTDANVMSLLLEFAYEGETKIPLKSVDGICEVSKRFRIKYLENAIIKVERPPSFLPLLRAVPPPVPSFSLSESKEEIHTSPLSVKTPEKKLGYLIKKPMKIKKVLMPESPHHCRPDLPVIDIESCRSEIFRKSDGTEVRVLRHPPTGTVLQPVSRMDPLAKAVSTIVDDEPSQCVVRDLDTRPTNTIKLTSPTKGMMPKLKMPFKDSTRVIVKELHGSSVPEEVVQEEEVVESVENLTDPVQQESSTAFVESESVTLREKDIQESLSSSEKELVSSIMLNNGIISEAIAEKTLEDSTTSLSMEESPQVFQDKDTSKESIEMETSSVDMDQKILGCQRIDKLETSKNEVTVELHASKGETLETNSSSEEITGETSPLNADEIKDLTVPEQNTPDPRELKSSGETTRLPEKKTEGPKQLEDEKTHPESLTSLIQQKESERKSHEYEESNKADSKQTLEIKDPVSDQIPHNPDNSKNNLEPSLKENLEGKERTTPIEEDIIISVDKTSDFYSNSSRDIDQKSPKEQYSKKASVSSNAQKDTRLSSSRSSGRARKKNPKYFSDENIATQFDSDIDVEPRIKSRKKSDMDKNSVKPREEVSEILKMPSKTLRKRKKIVAPSATPPSKRKKTVVKSNPPSRMTRSTRSLSKRK